MSFRKSPSVVIGLAVVFAWTNASVLLIGGCAEDFAAKGNQGNRGKPNAVHDTPVEVRGELPPPPDGDCPDPVCEGFPVPTGFSDENVGLTAFAAPSGSGLVAAGVGAFTQPADINLNVPGTSIVQALLYWNGEGQSEGDDTIDVTVNAVTTPVTGDLIGGPEFFFTFNDGMGEIPVFVTTFRADITTSGLVALGANTLTISGMDYFPFNIGAGLLVIYDDGTSNEIQLRDGQDLAFINFAPPLDAVIPQEFCFEPSTTDRTARLTMYFGSVGQDRPNRVLITDGNGNETDLIDPLSSADGDEWDTFVVDVNVPAGVSSLTIEAFSYDDGSGNLPASLTWIVGGLMIEPPTCPETGEEGCTPGYWKQDQHLDSWVSYSPDDKFDDVFGVDAPGDESLLEAMVPGYDADDSGSCDEDDINKMDALGRHAVAALLNAASGGVEYAFEEADIIQWVQDAYADCDFDDLKDKLEDENERGCPLN